MASLLERKLIVVTGKGGAGKSTIAGALGLLGARRGLRTIVVEVGGQDQLTRLYDGAAGRDREQPRQQRALGAEIELEPNLWSLSLDPELDLIDWMRDLGGRLPARVLASSSSFQYLAAAAPGAKELVSLVKLHELSAVGDGRYDLVVFDAPATGHTLAMLSSPRTLTAIVRSSPLAQRARKVQEILEDPLHTGYVAVTRATEIAVSETLELADGLRQCLDREFDSVVVNAMLPRRFTLAEVARLERATNAGSARSATRAARVVHERARVQQSQIARLRRHRSSRGTPPSVTSLPFVFVPQVDREALEAIAARLTRGLRLGG